MTSGGKSDKPGKENRLSGRPRIKVISIVEREGMFWFREMRGADGALYRLYHRRGEMYGFNVETDEILFERKEGGPHDGMGPDSLVLEQVADVFEFIHNAEVSNCVECYEDYPVDHVPDICDQCGFPAQIWTVKTVVPIDFRKLPFPLRWRLRTRDYWPNRMRDFSPNEVLDELHRVPLVGGWIIQDDQEHECHVVFTGKFLVSVLPERDENGDPVGTLADAKTQGSEEVKSSGPGRLVDCDLKPHFYFPEKPCPSCYASFDFFDASCPECGVEVL